MSEWGELRLSDAIEVKHGFAFPGDGFGTETAAPQVLTPGNFAVGGGFRRAKPKSFDGDYPAEYLLESGELVVTMTDLSKAGDTLGYAVQLPADEQFLHNQRIGLVQLIDPSLLEPRFFGYLTRTRAYRDRIVSTATGSTVKHTSPGRIGEYVARVPAVAEQRAIADVLGALDDKIAANEQVVQTADQLGRTILQARAETITGDAALGEIAEVVMGSSPRGEELNTGGSGIPFYQGSRDFGFRFPAQRVWTTFVTREAAAGDTLLSVRAPVGEVNVIVERVCIGRGVAAIRSKQGRPVLLAYLVRHAGPQWEQFAGDGTMFASVNRKQIESIRVPAFGDKEAELLEVELASLESQIRVVLAESRTLAALRDTLLPQLMSGKLRVRDAEKTVEQAI